MNWMGWSAIGTVLYVLVKKPESAVLVPKDELPVPTTPKPGPKPAPKPPSAPAVVTKTATVGGRSYKVTRAGLGIYRIELSGDPSVFETIGQNGPLEHGGDEGKLAQLRLDSQQFDPGLFK